MKGAGPLQKEMVPAMMEPLWWLRTNSLTSYAPETKKPAENGKPGSWDEMVTEEENKQTQLRNQALPLHVAFNL